MSLYRLGWAARNPAHDPYTVTVAIAPSRSGTFLAPSPTLKPSKASLTQAMGGEGGVILSSWLTSRFRCRAMTGTSGTNPRRSSGRRPNCPLEIVPFTFLLLRSYTGYVARDRSSRVAARSSPERAHPCFAVPRLLLPRARRRVQRRAAMFVVVALSCLV